MGLDFLKVLVTGANGFVGRTLIRELVKSGAIVRGSIRALAGAPSEREIEWVESGDLSTTTDWVRLLRDCNAVVHLAGRVHVMRSTDSDAVLFRRINCDATLALARAAAAMDVRRFVYLSTAKVMGEETLGRAFKIDDPPAPADDYARSKWIAEQGLLRLSADCPMRIFCLRPPLVYGPGVGGNFIRLLRLAASRVPLPLGGIPNRRSMISVWNLSAVILALLHTTATSGSFLVADEEAISTSDLLRRLATELGNTLRLFHVPAGLLRAAGSFLGKGDEIKRLTQSLEVDSSATIKELRWRPTLTLDEGLRRTARWYRKRVAG